MDHLRHVPAEYNKQNQSQTCLYALYVLSQRSEEELPGQTSRDQEMERLQEERKMMHRMAAAAAVAAAAMRCHTARCSGAAVGVGTGGRVPFVVVTASAAGLLLVKFPASGEMTIVDPPSAPPELPSP